MADRILRIDGRPITIQETAFDRAINRVAPSIGARRLRSRITLAIAGQWYGASTSRRSLSEWKPSGGSPDADILFDLPMLRERSRDLERNNPLAGGAINTTVTNVVGTGLRLQSRIDRDILSMDETKADALENMIQAEWRLFFDTIEIDAARTLTGQAMADMVMRQVLLNGDVFVNMPRFSRPGSPYSLKLQLIEADRICNENNAIDSDELAGGIRRDTTTGAPIEYHVLRQHPGAIQRNEKSMTWNTFPAFGARTGLRTMLHIFRPTRPGQSRGVPYLSPVIEPLKQLGRYTQAEVDAAVVASFFTVFVKTEIGQNFLDTSDSMTPSTADVSGIKLSPAAIVGLGKNQSIELADPKRPNTAFDPFVMAVLRQVGVALELPFEILIKHFTSSYSAARAALLDAWKFFAVRRAWLAREFYQAVYEVWMYEAVASGRIPAPGYLTNPLIRMAYLGSQWIGPSPGQIDPVKEVAAAEKRIDLCLSTREEETAALTGGSFEQNASQIKKERAILKDIGISLEQKPSATTPEGRAATPPAPASPNQPDNQDDQDEADKKEKEEEQEA